MKRALIWALLGNFAVACGGSARQGGGSAGAGGTSGTGGSAGASVGSGAASGSLAAAGTDAGGMSGGTAGASAGSGGDGLIVCGSQSCGASQYCVMPCCGGPRPQCLAKPDAGACPAGTHSGCTIGVGDCASPADCCEDDPCVAAAPYCSDQAPTGCLIQGRACIMQCA
jgi:hypothetical protein